VNPLQHLLLLLLRAYRLLVSPVLTLLFAPAGCGCRYTPTCSQYAMEAVRIHGAWRGAWLTVLRLGRCHPWGGCGADAVPPKEAADVLRHRISCRHGS
jgi:putative membrane protein insertion efficiency factor